LTRRYASHIIDRDVLMSWLRSVIVTTAMGAAVWLAMMFITPPASLVGTWRWAAIQLAAFVPVGIVVVWFAATMLRMPERWWAIGKTTPVLAAQID